MFPFYTGEGREPGGPSPLPSPDRRRLKDPGRYLPDPALVKAVNVALLLGQPLLLTGEPGTGKTQLAYSVSRELGYGRAAPLRDEVFERRARPLLHLRHGRALPGRADQPLARRPRLPLLQRARPRHPLRQRLGGGRRRAARRLSTSGARAPLGRPHRRDRQGAARLPQRHPQRGRAHVLQGAGAGQPRGARRPRSCAPSSS